MAPEIKSPPSVSVRKAVRRGRILVVDDEPMIVKIVKRTLSAEHDVVALDRAPDALGRIEQGERYDVILCDLIMPVMTGMEFLRIAGRVWHQVAAGVRSRARALALQSRTKHRVPLAETPAVPRRG